MKFFNVNLGGGDNKVIEVPDFVEDVQYLNIYNFNGARRDFVAFINNKPIGVIKNKSVIDLNGNI
jgi:hypothetical protein